MTPEEAARRLASLGGTEPNIKAPPRRRMERTLTGHTAIYCRDRANAVDLRMETRPAHLDWIRQAPFPVAVAGPLLSEDGAMIGSLMIVGSGDAEAVRAWAAGDPYAQAGLFDSVTITPFRHLIGAGLPRGAAEPPSA